MYRPLVLIFLFVSVLQADQVDILNKFHDWVLSNGIHCPKLEIVSLDGYSRSTVAKEDIENGEMILSVPTSAIMTPYNIFDSNGLATYLTKHIAETISDTDIAALQILYELNRPGSFWGHFLRTFPNKFDTPLFWTDSELKELQSSLLIDYIQSRLNSIQESYDSFFGELSQKFPDVYDPEVYSLKKFKWALSCVWSRSFVVKVRGDSTGGFVPMADMFNNDPNRIKISHRMTNTALELFATENIQKGEQIFAPYGRQTMSNGQLVMDYGFVLKDHPEDYVMIKVPNLNEDDPLYFTKLDIWRSLEIPIQVKLSKGKVPFELLGVGRVLNLVEEELDKSTYSLKGKISERNERATIRTSLNHLKRTLASYGTSIQEDEEILNQELPYRKYLAVQLRKQEKQIIQESIVALEMIRDELFPDNQSNSKVPIEEEGIRLIKPKKKPIKVEL